MSDSPSLPDKGDLVGGRFRITEHLGTGGFGTVFRAVQENVGRDVALKFLTPGVAQDPINVERFRREAFHVSQLRHPHTITLFDYGQTEDGLVYMVLEFLDGVALGDLIQAQGGLAWPRAAHVFIQVLKSLSEAHRHGLVHRDLKPENIFLCELFGEKDYVKVLDFGVAKMTMFDEEAEEEASEEALTRAGRIFGTPMYMAPEQACAEEITPATDVYALGLLLYETMTGKPPVTGRNRMDVIHKQIRDPVPVLGEDLEGTPIGDVIRRACMKAQEKRYQSASEFLPAFEYALREMRIVPAPEGRVEEATMPLQEVDARVEAFLQGQGGRPQASVEPPPLPPIEEVVAQKEVEEQPGDGWLERAEVALVGRDLVVRQLIGLVDRAAETRRGHLALLEGESGIGKTGVVEAVIDGIDEGRACVLVGHFRRQSLPLEALREALAQHWGVAHRERMQVDAVIRRDLERLGGFEGEEIDFVVDFIRPRRDSSGLPNDEAGVLFARLEQLLLALAQTRPLLLILEDAHDADTASLAFLEYLAVTLRTQAAPIAVLMSLRPEERTWRADLELSLRSISDNIGVGLTRVPLKRLQGRDLALLLDNLLPLEASLKERVAWLSQGVPLHAVQIVRYLVHEEKLIKRGRRWKLRRGSPRKMNLPPDLMDLMRLRLDQAIARHDAQLGLQNLLRWMAVLGMRTPVELLVGVLAESGDFEVDRLDEALHALAQEGVIRRAVDRNLVCVEFDSSLLRESLLEELTQGWGNRRYHKAAARHKLDFYRDQALEAPLVEIADHWRRAGEMDKYREALHQSARQSRERFDLRGAREKYRELVGLLDSPGTDDALRIDTLLALAELNRRLGEFGLSEDYYRRAVAERDVPPSGRATALRGLAHLFFVQRRNAEALDNYKQALRVSQSVKDVAGVAKALVGLSRVYLMRGLNEEGRKVRERLEQMLPHLPVGEIAGKVLLHLAEASQRRGDLKSRYDYLVRAGRQLEGSADQQAYSDVLVALGNALMDPANNAPDRMQRAGQMLRQALEAKRSIGDRHGVAEAYRQLGQLESEIGDYEAAIALLQQSLDIHEALGAPFSLGAARNGLAIAHLMKGEFERADQLLESAVELFKRVGDDIAISHVLFNRGVVALNRGDVGRAQALLREARRIKEAEGTSWALFDLRNHLAVAAMWLGDWAEAERTLEETLEAVDTGGTDEDRTIARSWMGLLRCFDSRLQLAALELGRARADAEDLGMPRVRALCEANAAFYAKLTESKSTFEAAFAQLDEESVLGTLHLGAWLDLLGVMAQHAVECDRNRQSARLLRCVAVFWERLGRPQAGARLVEQALGLEAELDALRTR